MRIAIEQQSSYSFIVTMLIDGEPFEIRLKPGQRRHLKIDTESENPPSVTYPLLRTQC
jgi:hypothetical protein